RARQIRGGRLHEQQLKLAESRNELAESRLRRLDDQIELMGQIRDTLAAVPPSGSGAIVGVIDVGSATMRLTVARRAGSEWSGSAASARSCASGPSSSARAATPTRCSP